MSKNNSGFTKVLDKEIYFEFINYTVNDDIKPLLVFLHEGLGCSKQWKDFPRMLSEILNCPALMYDRYGYGNSQMINEPRLTGFLNNEALEFLPEIFNNLGISKQKKILIGHSDGGSIALIYAAAFPETVIGVITEAAHVFIENISLKGIQDIATKYKNGGIKEKLEHYHGNNTDSMFNSWTNVWLLPESKIWNIEKYLPKICCPVLAIQGYNDEYGTVKQLESLKKYLAEKLQILFIPDCGHIPHFQAKELVIQEILQFLTLYNIIDN